MSTIRFYLILLEVRNLSNYMENSKSTKLLVSELKGCMFSNYVFSCIVSAMCLVIVCGTKMSCRCKCRSGFSIFAQKCLFLTLTNLRQIIKGFVV